MIRRIFLLALLALATPLAAQSVKLKAHEIEALLGGNTAVGKWEGVRYRQYFDADGSTIYAQEGARSTAGEWRVDPARDEYQSLWPRDADWEGWYVMEYAGDFFWVSKSTPPTPFKVLEGKQLVAAIKAPDARCQMMTAWAGGQDTDIRGLVSAAQPATCGSSLGLGGAVSQHCAWEFPYRADVAKQEIATLTTVLATCFGTPKPAADPLVNHPDSYDFLAFRIDGGTMSVSLKDKGALQRSYIFLRAERQPN